MTPIQLLQKELNETERDLAKSVEMAENGVIDQELHEIHLKNLIPKIEEYKIAINKLK